MLTQALLMLQALAMALMVGLDRVTVPALLALVTLQGILNAFDLPARQSFAARMVDTEDLPNALALNSSVFNAARVIGPALAGILVAALGEGACFLLNAASYLAVLFCMRAMRFDQPDADRGIGSGLSALAEGLGFAARHAPVRALLILLGLASVFGMPFTLLMPIFAGEILGGGARGLGVLMGCMGAGAFLAAAGLARRGGVAGLGRVVAAGTVGFGAALTLFAVSRSFMLSCVLLAIAGFGMITQAAATNQLLQTLTPDGLRGRVMSLYTIMFVGMAPFGSLLSGALAQRAGAPVAVAAGGLACVVSGLCFAALIPRIRRSMAARAREPVR
jgi:MFS family permease